MKVTALFSGSSGNSTLIQTKNTKILIDCGESSKRIVEALKTQEVNPEELDGIIITHEHSDHTKGLSITSKNYNIPIYANKETWEAMPKIKEKIDPDNIKMFTFSRFSIKDLDIEPFSIPHDAANPCSFNLYNKNKKISIATDIGHVNKNVIENLRNSSFVLLEANYDPDMLRYSRYPYLLKERIKGPKGHLSNDNSGEILCDLCNYGLKNVLLGHLSKQNNFPELAYKTIEDKLKTINVTPKDVNIAVASRSFPTESITI